MNRRALFSRSFMHLVLIFLTAAWFLPTLGLLVTSVRESYVVADTGWWTVFTNFWKLDLSQFTLDNYRAAWEGEDLGIYFWNSFKITIPSTVLPILFGAFASYALAWLKFPGRRVLLVLMILLLIVPLHTTFVPVLSLYNNIKTAFGLEMYGTIHGLVLAHTGYGLPLAVYLLYNFMIELPPDLFESASIDGANSWQMFWRVAFPLTLPGMASIAIFQFIWVWNSLIVTIMFMPFGSQNAPLNLILSDIGQMGQDWHKLTAAAFILIIVPMIVFFALQRYFVRGLLGGSVKG